MILAKRPRRYEESSTANHSGQILRTTGRIDDSSRGPPRRSAAARRSAVGTPSSWLLAVPILNGRLDRKAPQQLAGKTVGIKISIFGNSSWPLTARNGPKRTVLGPFWGIAGRLRLARKFITFFYCRAIKFFLRCLQSPNRRCLPRGGLRSAFPSSNPAFSPE